MLSLYLCLVLVLVATVACRTWVSTYDILRPVSKDNYPWSGLPVCPDEAARLAGSQVQDCYPAWLVLTHLPEHARQRMSAVPADVLAHIHASHDGDYRLQRIDHLQWLLHDIDARLQSRTVFGLSADLDRVLAARATMLITSLTQQPDQRVSMALLFGDSLSSLPTAW